MYVVGADGSGLRPVGGERYGAWSRDGSRIAHLVPGGSDVVLFSTARDGYDTRVLVRRKTAMTCKSYPPGNVRLPLTPAHVPLANPSPTTRRTRALVQDCAALLAMKTGSASIQR